MVGSCTAKAHTQAWRLFKLLLKPVETASSVVNTAPPSLAEIADKSSWKAFKSRVLFLTANTWKSHVFGKTGSVVSAVLVSMAAPCQWNTTTAGTQQASRWWIAFIYFTHRVWNISNSRAPMFASVRRALPPRGNAAPAALTPESYPHIWQSMETA